MSVTARHPASPNVALTWEFIATTANAERDIWLVVLVRIEGVRGSNPLSSTEKALVMVLLSCLDGTLNDHLSPICHPELPGRG